MTCTLAMPHLNQAVILAQALVSLIRNRSLRDTQWEPRDAQTIDHRTVRTNDDSNWKDRFLSLVRAWKCRQLPIICV